MSSPLQRSKTGFVSMSKDFSITPLGIFSAINWPDFPTSAQPDSSFSDLSDPVSVPSAGSYTIVRKSGDCTWTDATNDLAFTGTAECVLTVTAVKTGYQNKSRDFRLNPLLQFTSLTWPAFPSSAQTDTPVTIAAPVSVPATDSYRIVRYSGDCTWTDSTKTLSFSGITECLLVVTASKTGYQSTSRVFRITPQGVITATAGSYGSNLTIGGSPTPSPVTGVNPSDADAVYVSADESICTVDRDSGAVTGVDGGECRITLTLSKTGYTNKIIEYTIRIGLTVGQFKGKHLFEGLLINQYTKPAFGDVDGDGDQDLVVGVKDGTLKYYRRNAAGAATLFTELTGSDNPLDGIDVGEISDPAFADLDGDGDQDLVVGESNGTLKYYRQETSGFTERTGVHNPFNSIDVGTYSIPAFADINEDGKTDLVVGKANGRLNYYLNESTNSTIVFTPKTGGENPFRSIYVGGSHSIPTFADVDGDGDLDLVVGRAAGTLHYYLNKSSESTIIFTGKSGNNNPFNDIDVGNYSAPAFADLDGDDELDLVVGEKDGILNYYLNESTDSDTIFTEQTNRVNFFSTIDVGSHSAPTFADINEDSKLDLVIGESLGILNYYLNESSGSTIVFTEKTNSENPFDGINVGYNSTPAFADINGDGKQDMLVGESYGDLNYYLNESSGNAITFTPKTGNQNPFNSIDAEAGSSPAFIDLDGDGDLDLVVGEQDGILNYYSNDSTFIQKTGNQNPFNGIDVGSRSAPTFADIDGDGDIDLVVGEYDGNLNYYLNESTESTTVFNEQTGHNNPFNGIDVGKYSRPSSYRYRWRWRS